MTQTAPTAITNMRYVALRDLTVDHKMWTNPRTVTGLDDAAIAELGADIKARGIQVPLIVQKIKGSGSHVTNLVLEGQRRVLAANEVLSKDAEIPVVDRTVEAIELTAEASDELMLDMLAVAVKRDGLSSFELSEVAERLRKRDRKLSDISKAIGRSEGWISKVLKARASATPKLILRWRKNEITDEQFKELAEVKEPERQEAAVAEVVKARKGGDLGEARIRAKEIKEGEKQQQRKLCLVRGHNGERCTLPIHHDQEAGPCTDGTATWRPSGWKPEPKVVRGPQADLFKEEHAAKPKPAKKPTTARIALEEMIALADRRAPTHDYVKGLMDGVRFALAEIGPEEFGRPWTAYLARIDGSGAGKKKKRPTQNKAKAKKKPAKKGKRK